MSWYYDDDELAGGLQDWGGGPAPHDWEDAAEAAGLFLPWPAAMAFTRIDEGTPHLARVMKDGREHPEGCTCEYCSQLREAIGKAHYRDKHIAMVMAGKASFEPGPDRKPCGCLPWIVCGHPLPAVTRESAPPLTGQPLMTPQEFYRGQPCGKHQVPAPDCRACTELAATGHISDPDITCGCDDCTRERRELAAGTRRWRATPEWAAGVGCTCGQAPGSPDWRDHASGGCKRRAALVEVHRQDAQEIMTAIWAPLFLPEDQLPQYRPFPAGTCRECGGDPVKPGTNICWYCDAARGERVAALPEHLKPVPRSAYTGTGVKPARPAQVKSSMAGRDGRRVLPPAVLGLAGFTLLVLAAHVAPGLLLPGFILMALAVLTAKRGRP